MDSNLLILVLSGDAELGRKGCPRRNLTLSTGC